MVMLTLQSVRDNVGGHWNDDSRNLATSLFSSCSEFSFVISLVVAKYFFVSSITPYIRSSRRRA